MIYVTVAVGTFVLCLCAHVLLVNRVHQKHYWASVRDRTEAYDAGWVDAWEDLFKERSR